MGTGGGGGARRVKRATRKKPGGKEGRGGGGNRSLPLQGVDHSSLHCLQETVWSGFAVPKTPVSRPTLGKTRSHEPKLKKGTASTWRESTEQRTDARTH